ncbi:unnamed protein product [Lactuca saligna]|uniref:Uncharacterized protein n=1 Tax=Lactuca saligna TaxID=75948 RepID=A0AA35W0R1_LACSI|nr:unnamed protein product [Lactuca saligna]
MVVINGGLFFRSDSKRGEMKWNQNIYNVQQLKLVTEHWFDNNGGNGGCSGSVGSGGGHRGGSGSGGSSGGKGSGRGGDRCGGSYSGGGHRSSVAEKLFADYALPLGRVEVGDIVAPRAGLHKGKHQRVINIEVDSKSAALEIIKKKPKGSSCGTKVKRHRGGPGDGGGGHDDHGGFSGGDVKRCKLH